MNILITGVGGQDGQLLAQTILCNQHTTEKYKGCKVYGIYRSMHQKFVAAIDGNSQFIPIRADVTDAVQINEIVRQVEPSECYLLAAVSSTRPNTPQTFQVNFGGVVNVVEALHRNNITAKVVHASSSEIFGKCTGLIAEDVPYNPTNIYGISKAAAQMYLKAYRLNEGRLYSNAIFFNHESSLRPKDFVSQKIVSYFAEARLADLAYRPIEPLQLYTREDKRDWGYAGDYVAAMLKINADEPAFSPGEYVVGTGVLHTVGDFVEATADIVGVKGYHVVYTSSGNDGRAMAADCTKLKNRGWVPAYKFRSMIGEMVEAEIKKYDRDEWQGPPIRISI